MHVGFQEIDCLRTDFLAAFRTDPPFSVYFYELGEEKYHFKNLPAHRK